MKLLEVLVITTITLIVFAAETKGSCGPRGDIVFVLDNSGSIGPYNFNRMISFVKYIVTQFDVNKYQIQFGLITYSRSVFPNFNLNTYSDKQSIVNALGRVRYIGGTTNTAGALQYLRTYSFSYMLGHRRGVPKLAVVITDGKSDYYMKTKRQAQLAHSSGIQIMAIGVGHRANKQELRDIASDPDSEFLFDLNSFLALRRIRSQFAHKACRVVWKSIGAKPDKGTLVKTHAPSFDLNSRVHVSDKNLQPIIRRRDSAP